MAAYKKKAAESRKGKRRVKKNKWLDEVQGGVGEKDKRIRGSILMRERESGKTERKANILKEKKENRKEDKNDGKCNCKRN